MKALAGTGRKPRKIAVAFCGARRGSGRAQCTCQARGWGGGGDQGPSTRNPPKLRATQASVAWARNRGGSGLLLITWVCATVSPFRNCPTRWHHDFGGGHMAFCLPVYLSFRLGQGGGSRKGFSFFFSSACVCFSLGGGGMVTTYLLSPRSLQMPVLEVNYVAPASAPASNVGL